MAPARDPALEVPFAGLAREPLFWAAITAFSGALVGLVGTFWQVRLLTPYYGFSLSAELYSGAMHIPSHKLIYAWLSHRWREMTSSPGSVLAHAHHGC